MSIATIDVLKSTVLGDIITRHRKIKKDKDVNAWNVFTLSSYNNQLENFHSDVIASLLHPQGLHNEGNKFLKLFIDFLITCHDLNISISDYENAWVDTETMGRIDVGIFDDISHKCILIENKINNAPDMEEQLPRYYKKCVSQGYIVDAMVYLSLDGVKKAPMSIDKHRKITRNVAAFSQSTDDLISGWLLPCKNYSSNEDSSSLIHQYIKLIKHLNNKAMEQNVQYDFYQFVSDKNNIDSLHQAVDLLNNLNSYRRDEFQKQIEDYSPFSHIVRLPSWGNCATLFQYYRSNGNNFKLDVFFADYVSAWIRLWTPENDNKNGLKAVQDKLLNLGLLDDFEIEPRVGESSMMRKTFKLTDYEGIVAVDKAVLAYVNDILQRLRALPKK